MSWNDSKTDILIGGKNCEDRAAEKPVLGEGKGVYSIHIHVQGGWDARNGKKR